MQVEFSFSDKHRLFITFVLVFFSFNALICLVSGVGLIVYSLGYVKDSLQLGLFAVGIFLFLIAIINIYWLMPNIKRFKNKEPFIALKKDGLELRSKAHFKPEYVPWKDIAYIDYKHGRIIVCPASTDNDKSRNCQVLKMFYSGNNFIVVNRSSLPDEKLAQLLASAHSAATSELEGEKVQLQDCSCKNSEQAK